MEQDFLNRAECNAMRGVAILGISMHNYLHLIPNCLRENQETFVQENIDHLQSVIAVPTTLLPAQLLSFFGHYGVPLFILLSAFGLVRKYEHATQREPAILDFVRFHYLKLIRMMALGVLVYIGVNFMLKEHFVIHGRNLLAQFLMIANLLPHPGARVQPGPFWYFGMVMQIYVIYRLVLYKCPWWLVAAAMVACTAVMMVLDTAGSWQYWLHANFVAAMLPFGIGLLCARYAKPIKNRMVLWLMLIVGTILTYVMCLNQYSWFFVPLVACATGYALVKLLDGFLLKALAWVGSISACLFLAHPVMREVMLQVRWSNVYIGLAAYMASSIALSMIFRWILAKLPSPRSVK